MCVFLYAHVHLRVCGVCVFAFQPTQRSVWLWCRHKGMIGMVQIKMWNACAMQGTTVHLDEAHASSFCTSSPCKASASSEEAETELTSTKQHELLGDEISAYASHYLMLDEDPCTAEESRSPNWLSSLRHFHWKMIEAMETCECILSSCFVSLIVYLLINWWRIYIYIYRWLFLCLLMLCMC